MTKEKSGEEHIKFDAEVGKVLQLMIHSLYTNKDIFLRELVSNSSDACDKLRYLSLTTPDLIKGDPEFKIKISSNEEARTLTISDNGIGMDREDLISNIGTIAKSGTQGFMSKLTGDKDKDLQMIGQFGVGFYSGFMVADKIEVISRKAGEKDAWQWKSNGDGEYTIKKLEKSDLERGVSVTLHLKDGEDEFLDKFRLRHIVKTYSDHISFPIEFITPEGEV
jgi:molecular chaperone HtpG